MRGAIASVDFFVFGGQARASARSDEPIPGSPRRLTLTITAPERDGAGPDWCCRLALADLHRPRAVTGRDSLEALARAIDLARGWLAELREQGWTLTRDRSGETPFEPF